jgi:TfoX/Sxy family transcriptional regulator of competence genes
MSHQETVPLEQQQEQQSADEFQAHVPDPEVVPKAKRRQFMAKYKIAERLWNESTNINFWNNGGLEE